MTTPASGFASPEPASLHMGVIGNCTISALIDSRARIVWGCMPRFDADPVFCSLLGGADGASGSWAIELEDLAETRQRYEPNTAVLVTELWDRHGPYPDAEEILASGEPQVRTYHHEQGDVEVFLEPVRPAAALVLEYRLDLPDFGAKVGEDHHPIRPRERPREIQHLDAIKRTSHSVTSVGLASGDAARGGPEAFRLLGRPTQGPVRVDFQLLGLGRERRRVDDSLAFANCRR